MNTHADKEGLETKINGGKGGFSDLTEWTAELDKITTYIHTYIHICTYVCVYIYIYIYIYIHTHTHTYIHTHTQTKKDLETKINGGKGGFSDLTEWTAELDKITETIETKEIRWLELAEIANA